jgi:hypothetical protein
MLGFGAKIQQQQKRAERSRTIRETAGRTVKTPTKGSKNR